MLRRGPLCLYWGDLSSKTVSHLNYLKLFSRVGDCGGEDGSGGWWVGWDGVWGVRVPGSRGAG